MLIYAVFYGTDDIAKANLVAEVKKCCLHNGFFQIVGHRVPVELQEKILDWVKKFFAQPQEEKDRVHKDFNTWNRGYERIGSQILEAGTNPDLKEGYFIGEEISTDHPYFVGKKLNSGPNVWPETMLDVDDFRATSMEYYNEMHALARDVLTVIAQTLDLKDDYFNEFTTGAVATLRYLHYPPQPADSDEKLARGIGAHTDFGSVTLLMQGDVDGLQVYDKEHNEWLDVVPVKGAYVVNLGNMFMRWANDRYISNLHRVINKSGKERYSVPFFYSGNPDYVIECLPNCREEGQAPKCPPISVMDCVGGSYKASYGAAKMFKEQPKAKMEVVNEHFMFFAIVRSQDIYTQVKHTKMDSEKKDLSYSSGDNTSPETEIGTVVDIGDEGTRNFYGSSVSDSYRMKSEIVNQCMEEIGMGRYQWELFVVSGFGWITDNFWSQGIGSIQPSVALEFPGVTNITLSSVAYYAGLIFGAFFWGTSADLIGRKPAFNATLIIGGLFGTAVAGLSNFTAFCIFWTIIGTAAGGNVPVDSMIFLEFVPGSHQYLLTALSSWWMLGQVIVSLISWVFLANFASMTLVFAFVRIAIFKMPESPRYLISKGRDAEAVEAVNYIARRNKKPEPLTLAMLQEVDRVTGGEVKAGATTKLSRSIIIKENLKDFKSVNYKNLFANPQLARHTSIIWLIWLTIGIAYRLYFNFIPTYLSKKFTADSSLSLTYRNYCIQSIVSVFGPLSAAVLVNTRLGRRWMLGASAIVSGIFLFAYTAAENRAGDLAFSCITGLFANFEYAIMYAFTPESFPAPHRGTATGTAATLLRLGGICASLIGTYTEFSVVPIYVSASLWIVVGLIAFALPFETHGRAAI
ncbi:Clavaminate synthase-like protein [Aureobasidium melanogenum CBS 110374]|uniref:Clavaminate synthase-like protein n=1 Tax=Aureobasidium melanogenum (strain CBS 110374) TaxID=1043003 RepID=A0A074WVH5_AURM1|nr:Clavaminate synthase-like protein [Aureobasidium melanogenum CBS 110374]KEQ66406.1 Clavaminate synthase-like protein [Aureobasidium melanogenum CBS 110374]